MKYLLKIAGVELEFEIQEIKAQYVAPVQDDRTEEVCPECDSALSPSSFKEGEFYCRPCFLRRRERLDRYK